MRIPTISFLGNKKSVKVNKEKETPLKKQDKTPREQIELPDGLLISTPNGNIVKNVTDEELFDLQYNSATTLSDGSKLIRPVILSLGKVDIKPTDKAKEYTIEITPAGKFDTTVKKISEARLLRNKTFCKGIIQEISPEKFAIVYVDKMGQTQHYAGSKKDCLYFMQDNLMCM